MSRPSSPPCGGALAPASEVVVNDPRHEDEGGHQPTPAARVALTRAALRLGLHRVGAALRVDEAEGAHLLHQLRDDLEAGLRHLEALGDVAELARLAQIGRRVVRALAAPGGEDLAEQHATADDLLDHLRVLGVQVNPS